MTHPYLKYFEEQKEETLWRIKLDTERNRKTYATINVVDEKNQAISGAEIKVEQIDHEFKFGCNVFMLDQFPDEEHNKKYREMFPELFNYAIAPFYWSDFELEDGKPRFGKDACNVYRRPSPEKVIEYCNEKNLKIKGHPLVWHSFLPDWLVNNKEESEYRINRRIKELANEYGDRIRDWDVVNESLSSTYYDARLPHDFVIKAFKQADKHMDSNRLFINETTWRTWQSHLHEFSPYYMQIENLLLKGTKIDAIGLQYHLFFKPEQLKIEAECLLNPTFLFDVLDTYQHFNKPLHISEVTVPAYGASEENQELQAKMTEWLYRIWFSHASNESIVWWNFVDGTAAFAPLGSNEGENYYSGGLLNYDMTKKPVYKVLDNLINHEWKTNQTIKTENGIAKFNGFYGKYKVTINNNGVVSEHTINLSKNAKTKFDIVV